jgi:hypothetical protein
MKYAIITASLVFFLIVGESSSIVSNEYDGLEKELNNNVNTWKKSKTYNATINECIEAVKWVKENGKFKNTKKPDPIDFEQAMKTENNTLADAFCAQKLLGILAKESSFNTNLRTGSRVGPFQLGSSAVDDYNAYNDPDITYPVDIDGKEDLKNAARVAAWYLAYQLQQLTWKSWDEYTDLTPIEESTEAGKFAIAAYKGMKPIVKARKDVKEEEDPTKWDVVKKYLSPNTIENGETLDDYVKKISIYEKIFGNEDKLEKSEEGAQTEDAFFGGLHCDYVLDGDAIEMYIRVVDDPHADMIYNIEILTIDQIPMWDDIDIIDVPKSWSGEEIENGIRFHTDTEPLKKCHRIRFLFKVSAHRISWFIKVHVADEHTMRLGYVICVRRQLYYMM